ncbi:MAG TPA: CotH kinase family protein [Anaeromyxobacter sp.]|nr:CotH kinase family protein [Anaeromyxobacter sp.]
MSARRHGARRAAVARALVLAGAALALACGDAPPPVAVGRTYTPPADDGVVTRLPGACPDLYADDDLPTFELDIAEETWAALRQDQVLGLEVYRPAVFRHGAEAVPDAMVRLRGNNSRCGDKLQLAISFNQLDPDRRHHGVRRIDLDHGGCRVLEERLALSYLRDLGLPAPCANHARLVVNGAYYGLYVNLEHVNKDFLRRNFGAAADDGNLYKSGWRPRTNEETNDGSDLAPYRAAADAATLAGLVDLEEALVEWAAEAVLPARDNFWLHGWNYYLYHHPQRGFLFVPVDLDQAFPSTPGEAALPTLFPAVLQHPAEVALDDPAWRARYREAVRCAVAAYDPDALAARLDAWWMQIAEAAAQDPFLSTTRASVSALEARIRDRAAWLRAAVADPAFEADPAPTP